MSPSPLGRMPLQAIPYRLYHIPITGPDLLHHLVPGLVNPVLSGFGRRSTTEKAWKSCPYEGAGEGRRLAMSCVQLLLLGVNLSNSFSQGCQANRAARARSGRSGRSSLPARLCIACVQAWLSPVMAQSLHQQTTILNRV